MKNDLVTIPEQQIAVQLIGEDCLTLNPDKAVPRPGPRQILVRIEAVGLCFSDLKLLKQFNSHPRKSEIVSGISPDALAEIPSYVPGDKPTVPGHEAVCRIVAVGEDVRHHQLGERCLVQTDYRKLLTAGSNAAFGYNFEGALQEYVLLDERVIVEPETGERYMIPVPEESSASAIALVEPWACVEDSYVNVERRTLKAGGRILVVAETGREIRGIAESFAAEGPPAELVAICTDSSQQEDLIRLGIGCVTFACSKTADNEIFDDIIYFGAQPAVIESLNDKLAARGVINIVLGGATIGEPVSIGIGRVHYGMTRWIGTTTDDAAKAYEMIPATGEIRPGDSILVIGAGGPMGQMHVIRNVCSEAKGISVVAADMDDARLEALSLRVRSLPSPGEAPYRTINTQKHPLEEEFDYIALMVPSGALAAQSIRNAKPGCIMNVFAGIPAATRQEFDLDTLIARRCFLFGTSGSNIEDMKIVLRKIAAGHLYADCLVDAVAGMAGAIEGIGAVENRLLAGKVIVYPELHSQGFLPLSRMRDTFPTVADKMENGQWTRAAEQELLRVCR